MRRNYSLYLQDIVSAIDHIREYTAGMDEKGFADNQMIIDAVARNLEIIGEAVSKVPDEMKKQLPDVPWREIRNFRNIIAHRYWNIDTGLVWEIVQNKLRGLKIQIEKILAKPE